MVQNYDVESVLQRYNYNQICDIFNQVEGSMMQIENEFRFQNSNTQIAWQEEYQKLEYERSVLLAAINELERRNSSRPKFGSMGVNSSFGQPVNRFQMSRQDIRTNENAPMNYRRVGSVATTNTTQRGFGSPSDQGVQGNGLNRFARTSVPTPTATTTPAPRTNFNTQPAQQNTIQGENMLRNEGINLLGSNIPFATEANNVVVDGGNIIFKTNIKTNTIKEFKLDINTELAAGTFLNSNGTDNLPRTDFNSKSFKELADEVMEKYGCKYSTASTMILNTIYVILDRDMGVLGIDKILSKDSVFGEDEWKVLDEYVSGAKNNSKQLCELRNFDNIVRSKYRNIYDYIGNYIRGNYVVLENEVIGMNVFEAKCKVDETYSFLNFVNKYNNFKNFILPDGVNSVLHNIIKAAYNVFDSSFILKKYNDFLTINLVISDDLGYEYAFTVTKRYRPDQDQTVYMLKVCDMYVNVN